jgi:hypothetical protein
MVNPQRYPNEPRELDLNYGIKKYNKDQDDLHTDIMELLKSKKYKKISADDCMIVFGRVYSIYVLSQLKQEGKIIRKEK